jgi:hypothetical protein
MSGDIHVAQEGAIMSKICTHEVLPLSAPIAQRCEDCNKLMPYVPEPFGEPIVLTDHGAYAKSEYDRLQALPDSDWNDEDRAESRIEY